MLREGSVFSLKKRTKNATMKSMTTIPRVLLFGAGLGTILSAGSLWAGTLFGPGIIPVGFHETILITTVNADYVEDIELQIPDSIVSIDNALWDSASSPVFALTGPCELHVAARYANSNFFVTFQRITNSPIKTLHTTAYVTNFISVAAGRTIQLFPPIGPAQTVWVRPAASTNWMRCYFTKRCPSPSLTGPLTIKVELPVTAGFRDATVLSYYFTDEVVQFPPNGLLNVPAPQLQVNIEKSYDLQKWMPAAVFHTEAETGAFYRLRMLR